MLLGDLEGTFFELHQVRIKACKIELALRLHLTLDTKVPSTELCVMCMNKKKKIETKNHH